MMLQHSMITGEARLPSRPQGRPSLSRTTNQRRPIVGVKHRLCTQAVSTAPLEETHSYSDKNVVIARPLALSSESFPNQPESNPSRDTLSSFADGATDPDKRTEAIELVDVDVCVGCVTELPIHLFDMASSSSIVTNSIPSSGSGLLPTFCADDDHTSSLDAIPAVEDLDGILQNSDGQAHLTLEDVDEADSCKLSILLPVYSSVDFGSTVVAQRGRRFRPLQHLLASARARAPARASAVATQLITSAHIASEESGRRTTFGAFGGRERQPDNVHAFGGSQAGTSHTESFGRRSVSASPATSERVMAGSASRALRRAVQHRGIQAYQS